MRVVALISGGKDSCYNMMQCVAAGHEIVALANLHPPLNNEMDSYMYQTVGHDGISLYSEAMELPLFRRAIKGDSVVKAKEYSPTEGDEVEDLFNLLSDIKNEIEFDGISVGAILSDYQRIRVENVCSRLSCVSLSFLWRRDQGELLQEMIDSGMNAIIIKTASLGLLPDVHLGQTIAEMQDYLIKSKEKYGINICGEGGEYETFTLDCPLFHRSIVLVSSEDGVEPLSAQRSQLNGVPVKTPLDYLADLAECTKTDCCDGRVEICSKNNEEDKLDIENVEPSESSNNGNVKEEPKVEEVVQLNPEVKECPESQRMPLNRRSREEPFPVSLQVRMNSSGWCWAMGIQGNQGSSQNPMRNALAKLQSVLEEKGLSLNDLIAIVMYISDMEHYADYNLEYTKFFSQRPPVRVCVEAPVPLELPILLEGLAFRPQPDNESFVRHCLHVQGISHWAPANIGPYSQAIWVGDIIYVAGQIGLIPGSMKLVEGGARMECKLALRHINRIIKATDPKVELRDVVQGICYVTDAKFIEECRQEWETKTNNAIVEYLVVPRLPRDAKIEWQIWAHKHNTAFEYEETGCYIAECFKVRIIRRWSYENRVGAIVCRTTLRDHVNYKPFGKEDLAQMTEYAMSKLLRDSEKSLELDVSLRVFYVIGLVNPVDIHEVLEAQSQKYFVAFSILPVCSLVQENTIISFCGVRHQ